MLKRLSGAYSPRADPTTLEIVVFTAAQRTADKVLQLVLRLILRVNQGFAGAIPTFILLGKPLRREVT